MRTLCILFFLVPHTVLALTDTQLSQQAQSIPLETELRLKRLEWIEVKPDGTLGTDDSGLARSTSRLLRLKYNHTISERDMLVCIFSQIEEARLKSRTDLSLYDVKSCVKGLGYRTAGFKFTAHDFRESANSPEFQNLLPAIIQLKEKCAIFSLLTGADENYLYVLHPFAGELRLSYQEYLSRIKRNFIFGIIPQTKP